MKPDQLDIKIQEAAAQYEPVYNEQAWESMEKILDKEMPQKKDRRKIFWLLILSLLLLVTGSLLLLINYSSLKKEAAIVSAEKLSAPASDNSGRINPGTINKTNNETIKPSPLNINKADRSKPVLKKTIHSTVTREKITPGTERNNGIEKRDNGIDEREYKTNEALQSNGRDNHSEVSRQLSARDKNNQPEHQYSSGNISIRKKDSTGISPNNYIVINHNTGIKADEDSVLTKNSKDISSKKGVTKNKNKFINSIALNFSLGPDVSAVRLGNIGKINLIYGAGISYQLNKRLALRTGFYIVEKVYDANASDYHPPARFWNYYPDLKHIDANCEIYEVPLIINYNFRQTQKHHWFGSVGLSSYFMKKEDYDFISKNSSGQTSYNSYYIRNKNQHYLSSVRLSAGYEKKINNTLSILAEPYVNLPLNGIGYGKVNLYSAGALFTLSIKPFPQKAQPKSN